MEKSKEEPTKIEEKKVKLRQIIIETDGNDIKIVKAEVNGRIELVGILQNLVDYLNKKS